MNNLNNIPNVGNWGDAASRLNDNFNKIKQAITTIENTSKNNKGYFTSLSALNTAFPSPKAGQTAYVYDEASSTKYYIYNAVNGAWVATSIEAPSIGVDLEGYTKTGGSTKTTKQVDDEVAQLAGEVEQLAYVKIKNEVVNGNFENGLISPFSKEDAFGGASTLAINSSTPISGNYDARLTITTPPTQSNRPFLRGMQGAGNIGDKIYLHFYAKILSGVPIIAAIQDGVSGNKIYGGDVINGRNTRIIDVKGTGQFLGLIYFNSLSAWDMQMDNFMRINLTETFGAGNEPTEEEMNLLLDILGIDYFEGEITIPAQKVMQWLLESKLSRDEYNTLEVAKTNAFIGASNQSAVELIKNKTILSDSGNIIDYADRSVVIVKCISNKINVYPIIKVLGFYFYSDYPSTTSYIGYNMTGDVMEGAKYCGVKLSDLGDDSQVWQIDNNHKKRIEQHYESYVSAFEPKAVKIIKGERPSTTSGRFDKSDAYARTEPIKCVRDLIKTNYKYSVYSYVFYSDIPCDTSNFIGANAEGIVPEDAKYCILSLNNRSDIDDLLVYQENKKEQEIRFRKESTPPLCQSRNLCDNSKIEHNVYIASTAGLISKSSSSSLTDYIPIKKGQTLNVFPNRGGGSYHGIYESINSLSAFSTVPSTESSVTNTFDRDMFVRFSVPNGRPYYEVTDIEDRFKPFEYYNPYGAMVEDMVDPKKVNSITYEEDVLIFPNSTTGTPNYVRSDYIKVSKGAIIKFQGQISGETNLYSPVMLSDKNKQNEIPINNYYYGNSYKRVGLEKVPQDGFVRLQTFAPEHPNYDPDYPFFVTISYNNLVDVSDASPNDTDVLKTFMSAGFGNTPSIKAFKELNYVDSTHPNFAHILWNDMDDDSFYISKNKYSNKVKIFEWDATKANGRDSGMYSAVVMPNGDVLFVYRTEFHGGDIPDDNNRRNPIIYESANGYKPKIIDFGDDLKPTGWLQNVGVHYSYRYDKLFIAEYTRRNVPKARVWRVDMPVTDPSNWVVKIEKDIPVPYGSGFKHFHTVQGDPFHPVIYATSGDSNTASGIWYSIDGGETFILLDDYNSSKFRMLNMVFTKDYIYWASDHWKPGHVFWRASRLENGVMDKDSITQIFSFDDPDNISDNPVRIATYSSVYLECFNIIVFLDRADGITDYPLKVRAYDITTETLHTIGEIPLLTNSGGFRNEAVEIYPKDNKIIVSFGKKYPNSLNILGNDVGKYVNAFEIVVNRMQDGYKATYKTLF